MSKVTDDNAPCIHHLLALDPDAGAAAQGPVRVVRVGAVDAELDGARVWVDGDIAVGQGAGEVLVAGGLVMVVLVTPSYRITESRMFDRLGLGGYLRHEAIVRVRDGHEVEAIYQSLSGVGYLKAVRHCGCSTS